MSSSALTRRRKQNAVPVLLEVLPGLIFQTFGIGHIVQGRVGMGLFIMLSYWLLQAFNVLLMGILIGYVTAPLTWLFYMIAAPMNAADHEGD